MFAETRVCRLALLIKQDITVNIEEKMIEIREPNLGSGRDIDASVH
jgi:hypothetical protein